jgi:deazaflavin-dependent oxidoreductase (nitroreductase family)
MARPYVVSSSVRRVNRIMSWMARRGLGRTEVLTAHGRKSGETRTTPVTPITIDGVEYLVAPYGAKGWVHNVRAGPAVELRRGSRVRRVRLTEVTGPGIAHVVAAYHAREGFARRFMDVPENPQERDFAAAADRFPVFRVESS